MIKKTFIKFQKQPFADVFQDRCSKKFHNIYRETSALELLTNKVAGPEDCNFITKRFQQRYFLVHFIEHNTFFQEHLRTTASVLLIIKLVISIEDLLAFS